MLGADGALIGEGRAFLHLRKLESEPQAAPVQPAPESDQATPLFCESFCKVAVKLCVPAPA